MAKHSISRRAALAGITTATLAPIGAAASTSDDLALLIEAHRAAYRVFCTAIDQREKMEDAYKEAHAEPVIVPSLLGGGCSITNGLDQCKASIAAGYDHQRASLTPLSRIAPELAEQTRIALDAKEAENMALIERVFADEDARQEAFGLTAVVAAYEAASDAEDEAATAICAYRCRTLRDARIRAEYLATAPGLRDGLQDHHVEALLASFRDVDA